MTAPESLSALQARRIALLAQGFGDRRPAKPDAARGRFSFRYERNDAGATLSAASVRQ